MGVHGLSTYLADHRHALAVHALANHARPVPVVVDAWSFIYEIVRSGDVPWLFGGEYPLFAALVEHVANAWIAVGLEPHFVFDGPYPALKFPTLVSRLTHTNVHSALLFFRTSPAARASPRFLLESAVLPPLAYSVCVHTLLRLASPSLHVHFADEEGDPYAVALAATLHAYIIGRDSDFVVLNADGYRGYIPLDEMLWTLSPRDPERSVDSLSESADIDDNDGFQLVRNTKNRNDRVPATKDIRAGRGILPPDALALLPSSSHLSQPVSQGAPLALSYSVYTPAALATHLGIPVSLLPLLGAFLGNDYTAAPDASKPNLHRLFFDRQLTIPQRITRVAATLSTLLATALASPADPRARRGKKPISSVIELIDAAVSALLVTPSLAAGEREAVVDRIAEATLQYAVPRSDRPDRRSDVCALHTPDTCPLFENARSSSLLERVREQYIAAYRHGHLDPRILDTVHTGTMWPRTFLEDPDKECVARSVARPIRLWLYAIVDAGVGLPQEAPLEDDDEVIDVVEDDDEVIDVVEDNDEVIDVVKDDADPLARLQGALKGLDDGPEDAATVPPQKVVTEYLRRGARIAAEEVSVPTLPDMLATVSLGGDRLPPQLWPDDARRTLFLRALASDHPAIAALRDEDLVGVLAVRSVVRTMHARAEDSPGVKARFLERWTQAEARAVLTSFSDAAAAAADTPAPEEVQPAAVSERHIQLVAQVLAALDAVVHLAQVLLLSIPSPASRFSGRCCHGLLRTAAAEPAEDVWHACMQGLEDAYAVPPQRKVKDKKTKTAAKAKAAHPTGAGMFGLLADAQA